MRTRYTLLFVLFIFSLSLKAQTQAIPISISGISPVTNRNIKDTQSVITKFSATLNPKLQVDSTIIGYGHLSGSYDANQKTEIIFSTNQLFFQPNAGYKANERIQVSVTKNATSTTGTTTSNPKVFNYRVMPDAGYGQFGDSLLHSSMFANSGMLFQMADMDANGYVDVVVYDSTSGNIRFHTNNGTSLSDFSPYLYSYGASAMHLADLNADGYPEVLLFFPKYSSISIFTNDDGTIPYYSTGVTLPSSPQFNTNDSYIPMSGDIDADGDLDIVVSCGSVISVITNQKFGLRYTVTSFPVAGTGSNKNASLVDIDNDGDLDILTDGLTRYTNNGTGTFTYVSSLGITSMLSQEDVDIDNDGDVDMVQMIPTTNGVIIRTYTNVAGVFSVASSVTVPLTVASADAITSGDFDGNGSMDIALTSKANKAYVYLLNKGNGTLGAPLYHRSDAQEGVWAADMDNDGDVDLVSLTNVPIVGAENSSIVRVYYNQLPCNPLLVTRIDDYGPNDIGRFCGTLRYAIETANNIVGKDTIRFAIPASLGNTINITSNLNSITEGLVIKGPGKDKLILDGQDNYSLFTYDVSDQRIPQTDTIGISGLTLQNGIGTNGAGISFTGYLSSLFVKNVLIRNNIGTNDGAGLYFNGKDLIIDSSIFSGNSINRGEGGAGAYITPQGGKVSIKNSTFSDNTGRDNYNSTSGNGNALYVTGNSATIQVEGCSFLNNSSQTGGAVYFTDVQTPDSLALINCTFAGNYAAGDGGALYINTYYSGTFLQNVTMVQNGVDSIIVYWDGPSYYAYPSGGGISLQNGNLRMANSILISNFSKYTEDLSISEIGNFKSSGGNLFGDVKDYSSSFALTSSDLSNINPLLSPLSDNGGLTKTLVPLPGSPVINKGVTISTQTAKDQRGDTRTIGTSVDIGAVESQNPACANPYYVTSTSDGYECGSLRLAVFMANQTKGEQTITFAPNLKGDSIVLGSEITISEGLTMKGILGLAISGNNTTSLLNSSSRSDTSKFAFSHLIFRNSNSGYAAVRHTSKGNLSFIGCDFVNNKGVYNRGGGLAIFNANASLDSCRFIGNYLEGGDGGYGAGFYYEDSVNNTLLVNHSSFIQNIDNRDPGGGMYVSLSDSGSKITISNTTFEGNRASSGSALYIYSYSNYSNANTKIINSTFSGNNASYSGVIYSELKKLTLVNSTLFKNIVTSTNPNGGFGNGGISLQGGQLNLQNTVIAGSVSTLGKGYDIYSQNGIVKSLGNNFISDTTGSAFVKTSTDLIGFTKSPLDPQLDTVLALNGGITKTHIPLQGSPVIDKGNSAAVTNLPLDQRGHKRIYASSVDIGSVEYDGPYPFPVVFAGKDSTTCDSTRKLKATPVTTPFKGYWTLIGQKASKFIADTTKASTNAKLVVGVDQFVWNVTDGTTTKKDTLKITRSAFPSPSILTLNKEACSDTFTLKVVGADTYKWRIANQKTPDTLKIVKQIAVKGQTATEVYSTVSNYKAGTNALVLTSLNTAGCSHTDTTSLLYFPGKPFAGFDTTVYADTVKLKATAFLQNNKAISGNWHVLMGKSVVKDSTLLQPEARKLSVGVNRFQYTVKTTCLQKDTVDITYVYVSDTAKAGPNQSICQDSAQLFASRPIPGATGKWTFLKQTTAVLSNDTLYNAKLRKIPKDTVALVWTITVTKTKKVSKDTVVIINNLSPVKAIAGTYTLASYDTITLKGNIDGTAASRWRRLSGTGIFQDSTAHSTKVTNLSLGQNKFLYIFPGVCPRQDTAKVNFQLPVVKTSAGKDTSSCSNSASITAQAAPVGYTGAWRNVNSTNLVFQDSTLNKTKVNGLVEGKNRMVWLIKKGKFVVGSDTLVITQLSIPTAKVKGTFKDGKTYIRTCINTATIEAYPINVGDSAKWISVNRDFIANPKLPSTAVSGLHPLDSVKGPDKFVWTVSNGICTATDTLNVYYAVVVYTRTDISVTPAGKDAKVFVTSNDIYSLGDELIVKPVNFVIGPNQPITGYQILADTVVLFHTNPRSYAFNRPFTYRLYAKNCPSADTTATGIILINTENVVPNVASDLSIDTVSGVNYPFKFPMNLFDGNPNIDSVVLLPNPKLRGKFSVFIASDSAYITLSVDYSAIPDFQGNDTVRFRVYDHGFNNKLDSADEAIIVSVTKTVSNTDVTVYNGLSPNGDGKNDVVEMLNIEFHKDNSFKVFNRWGDKVYSEKGYNGKDVAFDGKDLPDGTYYYVLEFGDGTKRQEGYILLKR